jgi:hypothetical protein
MHTEYGDLDSDFVFVNLWEGEIGRPLSYAAVDKLVGRTRRLLEEVAMSDEGTGETSAENWLHGRLAWKGKHDDVRMLTSFSTRGGSWSGQHDVGRLDRGTSHGPALVGAWDVGDSGNLQVLIAWRGIGADSHLWYSTMQGQDWSGQHPLGDAFVSSHGPALAAFGDSVMIAFRGDGDDRQLYSSLHDGRLWSAPEIFSWGGSSHAPAIAGSGRDNVCAAWKGHRR